MSGSDLPRGAVDAAPPARSVVPGRALRHAAKVLPEHARAHNRALVLQTLFHQGAMSRADLSRETGLTRVTISDLVAELIDDGYVAERGMREVTGPGKPAILVDLDREGHRIVGLDLSGTDRFLGAILTLDGEIVARRDVTVPADPADILGGLILGPAAVYCTISAVRIATRCVDGRLTAHEPAEGERQDATLEEHRELERRVDARPHWELLGARGDGDLPREPARMRESFQTDDAKDLLARQAD